MQSTCINMLINEKYNLKIKRDCLCDKSSYFRSMLHNFIEKDKNIIDISCIWIENEKDFYNFFDIITQDIMTKCIGQLQCIDKYTLHTHIESFLLHSKIIDMTRIYNLYKIAEYFSFTNEMNQLREYVILWCDKLSLFLKSYAEGLKDEDVAIILYFIYCFLSYNNQYSKKIYKKLLKTFSACTKKYEKCMCMWHEMNIKEYIFLELVELWQLYLQTNNVLVDVKMIACKYKKLNTSDINKDEEKHKDDIIFTKNSDTNDNDNDDDNDDDDDNDNNNNDNDSNNNNNNNNNNNDINNVNNDIDNILLEFADNEEKNKMTNGEFEMVDNHETKMNDEEMSHKNVPDDKPGIFFNIT